jgi:hypothetical protein
MQVPLRAAGVRNTSMPDSQYGPLRQRRQDIRTPRQRRQDLTSTLRRRKYPLRDRPAVHRFQRQDAQKQQVKRALDEIALLISVTEWRVVLTGARSKEIHHFQAEARAKGEHRHGSSVPPPFLWLCPSKRAGA